MAVSKQSLISIFTVSFLFFFYLQCSTTSAAQAPAPGPPPPPDIIKILQKAGDYSIFVRLLKSTQINDRIVGELGAGDDDGKTIFAPTDEAFSNLQSGALNSLTDEQRVDLMLYHVVPNYIPLSQFQTVSNPMRTQAGDSSDGAFPLNVTTAGKTVTLKTGLTKTNVAGTIYTDGQLAIYRVDQVLQPMQIFAHRSSGPAPAPGTSRKDDVTGNSKALSLSMPNLALFAVSVLAFVISL